MNDVVALFAGAGGFSTGFAQQGLKPKVAAELNADACETYALNLGTTPLNLDLGSIEAPQILAGEMTGARPWAIVGGPPCQGFSTAGTRKEDDPRNRLILNYLRIVERLKPAWFVLENVEGILTTGNGIPVTDLVRRFVDLGYWVRIEKINFARWGLGQSRKRVVIAGNRLGIDFYFPAETHSFNAGKHKGGSSCSTPAPDLTTSLAELPEPYRKNAVGVRADFDRIADHYWQCSASDLDRIALLRPGQTMKDLPEECWHSSYSRRANRRVADGVASDKRGGAPAGLRRLYSERVSPTITSASSREFIHPQEDRPLTLRECARLQSFPDSYVFVGNDRSKAIQIGNAVPPLAASKIAKMLLMADGTAGSGLSVDKPRSSTPALLGYSLTDANGMSPALKITDRRLAMLLDHKVNNMSFELYHAA